MSHSPTHNASSSGMREIRRLSGDDHISPHFPASHAHLPAGQAVGFSISEVPSWSARKPWTGWLGLGGGGLGKKSEVWMEKETCLNDPTFLTSSDTHLLPLTLAPSFSAVPTVASLGQRHLHRGLRESRGWERKALLWASL